VAKAYNQFETITIDMTWEHYDPANDSPLAFTTGFLEWSIRASITGVKTVVAVFDTRRNGVTTHESEFVKRMHDLELMDAKVEDGDLVRSYGAHIKVLRWENESGASLKTKRMC
jgi:hypothetical protein